MLLRINSIKTILRFCSFNRNITIMASSSSSCEPTPEKKSRIDNEVVENKSNAWRSKLRRGFNEVDVGITEFIGKQKPFEGILKNRYEDFVVHEISKTGEIIRLTNNDIPEDEVAPVLNIYEFLNEDIIEQIRELCDNKTEELDEQRVDEDDKQSSDKNEEKSEKADKNVKILVTGMDKLERTRIHKAIKDNFPELDTLTVDEEENKYIIVTKQHNTKRKRSVWPENKGEYVHFVMFKQNKETSQAINELALKLHISPKTFSFAGTKDKRAITTQKVCAWRVPPKKIWYSSQKIPSTHVGDFTFEKEEIKLGCLNGNHFDIVLRDIKCDDREEAESALNSVKNIGFINYYGMQRFGHQYDKPYKIGVSILQQKWKQVVETILSPKPTDIKVSNPNAMTFNECIELWRSTGNANLVYKKFAFKSTPEGTLLRGLTRVNENDFHGALCNGMVRNSRMLYIHCFQSYIWNKAASFRFKTYGLKVVPGDLISINSNIDNEIETDGENNKNVNETNSSNASQCESSIVYADENNLNNASIYDIVIPIVGSQSLLPKNKTSDYIKSLLAEEEVTIDMFRDLPKQWNVCGSYRKLFVRPEQFEWSWIPYTDPNKPLIQSDLDLINKSKNSENTFESETDSNSKTEKLALKLSMCLQTSCYATVMCREITKTESTDLEYKTWLMSKFNL